MDFIFNRYILFPNLFESCWPNLNIFFIVIATDDFKTVLYVAYL